MNNRRRPDGLDPVARSRSRRRGLQAIYAWQINGANERDLIAQFAHEQAHEVADLEYFEDLVRGVLRHVGEVDAALGAHLDRGVDEAALDVVRVPGAWELPLAARELAMAGRHAAIVALGCVVRGDTRHYEQVADGTSDGLMRVALDTGVPVANGVLAVERYEDASARAGGSHGNKGEEAALVAIEMADLRRKLQQNVVSESTP